MRQRWIRPTVKPPLRFASLNLSHPLAMGLSFYNRYDRRIWDEIQQDRRIWLSYNASSFTELPSGPARRFIAANTAYDRIPIAWSSSTKFTIMVRCVFPTFPASQVGLWHTAPSGLDPTPGWLAVAGRAANKLSYYAYGRGYADGVTALSSGVEFTSACSYDGTTLSFYVDGKPDATRLYPTGGNQSYLLVGAGYNAYPTVDISWVGLWWDRALKQEEVAALSWNPWVILDDAHWRSYPVIPKLDFSVRTRSLWPDRTKPPRPGTVELDR